MSRCIATLRAWRIAATRRMATYSRYGSTTYKQVYIYGGLDTGPTELNRAFGMAWGLGGWLLTPFLMKIGAAEGQKLRDRVAAELKTTFASHYTQTVSLAGALVTDIGSPASHGAIVARELGITCVVGTGNGTRVLRTGDVVRVDGVSGEIAVLKRTADAGS